MLTALECDVVRNLLDMLPPPGPHPGVAEARVAALTLGVLAYRTGEDLDGLLAAAREAHEHLVANCITVSVAAAPDRRRR